METAQEIKKSLTSIQNWAQSKIDAGTEPPWAWYQYMKLIETVQTILISQNTVTKENLQQSVERSGNVLRLVASTSLQETAQPHHDISPPHMPM